MRDVSTVQGNLWSVSCVYYIQAICTMLL